MVILGIDHGSKRIGLALSDETETLARDLDIVDAESFFTKLPEIIETHFVEKIVLGLPLSMSGQDSNQTAVVRAFKEQLASSCRLPVELVDERLSSVMAHGQNPGQGRIDDIAAQILLQTYLDRNKNKH